MNDTMGQSLEKASKVEESQREGAVAMDCAGDEVKEKVGALSGVPADCDFTKPPLPSAGWTRSKTRKRTRNEPHRYMCIRVSRVFIVMCMLQRTCTVCIIMCVHFNTC